ncbi:D-alanyl-D-alanine carboxypeptidase family protein [Colwellia maritima]|uniref:D-alanyl-D-alanine carboxypeptidase family protein n=1 Tax=Colwellia maritima TaxID=2912588 RepID=UPI00237B9B0E|nr:D-alanyl-D-alanine carboxypeptidase family protein [Colwellia maritima]
MRVPDRWQDCQVKLAANATKHGFYFPYDVFRGGVAAEPWHLSYVPLAKQYQSQSNNELLQTILEKTDISGKTTIIENLPTIFKQYINNIQTIDY